jgi:hypothetical protein
MITRAEIAAEVEAFGLEMVRLRKRMRTIAERLHRQGLGRGMRVTDQRAFDAYCALYDAARPLYSRGHALKRLGRQLRERAAGGNGGPRS